MASGKVSKIIKTQSFDVTAGNTAYNGWYDADILTFDYDINTIIGVIVTGSFNNVPAFPQLISYGGIGDLNRVRIHTSAANTRVTGKIFFMP